MRGEYYHSIDDKGRLNFPSRLRETLGARFYLSKGLDNCIAVYSESEWEAFEERLRTQSLSKGRKIQRFFLSGAIDVAPDKQGRVLIPQNLRAYAEMDKEVVIIGAGDRAEIWDKKRWEASCDSIDSEDIAQMMDDLDL